MYGSEHTVVFPDVYCKYCAKEYVQNVARMKKHLVCCSKVPSCVKVKTATLLSVGSEAASKPSRCDGLKSAKVAVSVLHMPPVQKLRK
jgi:hypothetical protein